MAAGLPVYKEGEKMDSNRIMALVVVGILVAAAAGGVYLYMNDSDDYDLSVVYLNKSGYETQMVANEKGFFGDAGVKIKNMTVTGSGADTVNALLAGSADIAATGEGPVASAIKNHGDDIVVLCNVNASTGGQVWVAGPHITTDFVLYDKTAENTDEVLASWEGAKADLGRILKLGVQKGATTESALKSWLEFMGINYSDFDASPAEGDIVQLVNVSANELVSIFALDGEKIELDMMAASQPYPSNALERIDGSVKVGDNSDNDGYGISCYITTKDIYEKKSEVIFKFLNALKLATDYMQNEANEDECVSICKNIIGASDATVRAVFDIGEFRVSWDDEISAKTLYNTAQSKGFTKITLNQCIGACPQEVKDHIEGMYA